MTPLLSIILPTFNRADVLRSMLYSLVPQVAELGGDVELIVCDNASTDHTSSVVEEAKRLGPLQYHRHATNTGSKNFIRPQRDLAVGEYCWVLGDDDMVIRGALPSLLETLRQNPALDYFFLNYCFEKVTDRDRIILESSSQYLPETDKAYCKDFSNHPIDRWESIFWVPNRNPSQMFTAIMCHVIRRRLWCEHLDSVSLLPDVEERILTADNMFPHVKIVARAMAGKPAYYLGTPSFVCGVGTQEWSPLWPAINLVCVTELVAFYESLGMDRRITSHLRFHLLAGSRRYLRAIILDKNSPGRKWFRLHRFLLSNWRYPKLLASELLPVLSEQWKINRCRDLVPNRALASDLSLPSKAPTSRLGRD